MNGSFEPTEEQRDELVEQVAREIQLRGLTSSAVHFLEASRPYRALGSNAMLFFDPVLRGVFGGDLASARAAAYARGETFRYHRATMALPPDEVARREAAGHPFAVRFAMPDEEIAWDA